VNNDTPKNSDTPAPSNHTTQSGPSATSSPGTSSTPSSPTTPSSASHPTGPRSPSRITAPTITTFLASLAGTAILGIPAGYIWALVAPRALAQVVSRGAANVVNAETTAFIAADAWFLLIATVGGLLTGVLGYRYVARRRDGAHGAPAALGLILGGLGATAIMWWIGDNYGRASFHHALLTKPAGTYLHASLSLGAKSALIFWPLLAALAIAVPELVAYIRGQRSPGVRNVDEAGGHEARSVD
jgi:hypothetical protein